MAIDPERFKSQLEAAFPLAGTPLQVATDVGDIDGVDAEDLRRDFPIGLSWDSVPDTAVDHNCYSLAFFSDEAFRYYLPAFLLRAVSNNEVHEFLIYSLAPDGPLDDRFRQRYEGLTCQQASCVLTLLKEAEAKKGYQYSNEVINYWMNAARH